jgi:fatty acid desaturase
VIAASIPGPKEQVIPERENLLKALFLIAALAGSFLLANSLFHWLPIGLLAIVDVILLTGVGVLAHDAVHRALFRSPFWNEVSGGLLSALVLLPFQANRHIHLTHHSHAHQPGLDPEEAMHRYPFAVAVLAGAAIGFYINYRQLLVHIAKGKLARAAQDVFFLCLGFTIYFVLVPALGISLAATVVPVLVAFPLVFSFRAISDHYGLPAVQRGAKEERDNVTGWVVLTPRWLEWLWSHVNYHEVHHKYPWLAHSYLPQVFAATCDKHPYAVANGYWLSLYRLRKLRYYG